MSLPPPGSCQFKLPESPPQAHVWPGLGRAVPAEAPQARDRRRSTDMKRERYEASYGFVWLNLQNLFRFLKHRILPQATRSGRVPSQSRVTEETKETKASSSVRSVHPAMDSAGARGSSGVNPPASFLLKIAFRPLRRPCARYGAVKGIIPGPAGCQNQAGRASRPRLGTVCQGLQVQKA